LALATLTVAALNRVVECGFIEDFDDNDYVTANDHVHTGLSGANLRWAFCAFHSHNWHPLTWLSLQLDAQLWGPELKPWGFHLTNLVLHTINVLLLFWLLVQMTQCPWRSAMVAALFGVHPLHVESVAWVAERKDVLAAFFALVTISGYVNYVKRPNIGRYVLVLLAFGAGLMAKPMLVTLPCLLLLLDYWPLGRWHLAKPAAQKKALTDTQRAPVTGSSATEVGWLVLEKAPLLLLSATSCIVTVLAQRQIVYDFAVFPLWVRLLNAVAAYGRYLQQTLWPVGLAFFYPHPEEAIPWWQPTLASVLLVGISLAVWRERGRRPYLVVGWLWYLGSLVPVIGLVQVALQAQADRYTYLPLIGIFLALTWYLSDLVAALHISVVLTVPTTLAVLIACLAATRAQVMHWRTSKDLWQRCLAVTDNNFLAHHNLGMCLLKEGDLAGAEDHFHCALQLKPQVAAAHYGLGVARARKGEWEGAIQSFSKALELNPRLADAYHQRGLSYYRTNRFQDAAHDFEEELRLRPSDAQAHTDLGGALTRLGDFDGAARHYGEALSIQPDDARAHMNFGMLGMRQGQHQIALEHFQKAEELLGQAARDANVASRLQAQYAQAIHLAGQALARQRQYQGAITCFRRAAQLNSRDFRYCCSLAHALQGAGDVSAAEEQYRATLQLEPRWPELVDTMARILATARDPGRRDPMLAIDLAEQVCEATKDSKAAFLDTLAAAYAAAGRFDDAVHTIQKALIQAKEAADVQPAIRTHLLLYQRHTPLYEDLAAIQH
jgi:Flp pilus assembly protein TadD